MQDKTVAGTSDLSWNGAFRPHSGLGVIRNKDLEARTKTQPKRPCKHLLSPEHAEAFDPEAAKTAAQMARLAKPMGMNIKRRHLCRPENKTCMITQNQLSQAGITLFRNATRAGKSPVEAVGFFQVRQSRDPPVSRLTHRPHASHKNLQSQAVRSAASCTSLRLPVAVR